MTRWARSGSTQRHQKQPQDPTPWEQFDFDPKKDLRFKRKKCEGKTDSQDFGKSIKIDSEVFPSCTKSTLIDDNRCNSNNVSTGDEIKSLDAGTSGQHKRLKDKKKRKHKSLQSPNSNDVNSCKTNGCDQDVLVELEKTHAKKKRKKNSNEAHPEIDCSEDNFSEDFMQTKSVELENVAVNLSNQSADSSHFQKTHVKKKRKRNSKEAHPETDRTEDNFSEDIMQTKSSELENVAVDLSNQSADSSHLKKTHVKKKKQRNLNANEAHPETDCSENDSSKSFDLKNETVSVDQKFEESGNASRISTKPPKEKFDYKKGKHFMHEVRERRLQNGILLLPPNIERRIYLLKRRLRDKGMPGEIIKQIIRKERRKEELKYLRTMKTCFKCRKVGHVLSKCPEINADVEQGTGICFKCGSTEHSSYQCHIKAATFAFAKCFICHEQGHLSRTCPKNTRGAYPRGGKCNLCGEIDHLRKDCPLLQKQKDEEEVTADTLSILKSVDDEVIDMKKDTSTPVHKKPKIIKF